MANLLPEVQQSAEALDELLADDFLEFGRSGRVYDKRRILEELPNRPPVRVAITDFQVRFLVPGLALVTYRSARLDAHTSEAYHAVRSSIRRRSDGAWQMVFHHRRVWPP